MSIENSNAERRLIDPFAARRQFERDWGLRPRVNVEQDIGGVVLAIVEAEDGELEYIRVDDEGQGVDQSNDL